MFSYLISISEWKELQEQVKKMSYILTNRGQVAGGTSNIRN